MTQIVRAALILGALALAGLIFRAFALADFFESFGAIAADPWGLVSLVDLYLGFVMFAVVMVLMDGRGLATIAWVVALFTLGNVVGAAWLALRMPELVRRLSPAR